MLGDTVLIASAEVSGTESTAETLKGEETKPASALVEVVTP